MKCCEFLEDRKNHLGLFVVHVIHTEDSIHGLPNFSVMVPFRATLSGWDISSPNPTSRHGQHFTGWIRDRNWIPPLEHFHKVRRKI